MEESKLRFDEDEIRESLKTRISASLLETIIFTLKVDKCTKWYQDSVTKMMEIQSDLAKAVEVGAINADNLEEVAKFETRIAALTETCSQNEKRLASLLAEGVLLRTDKSKRGN